MTQFDLETILDIPEDQDREYKLAGGGLPRSLWESYSGMANSNGGHIVLGVEERGGVFTVTGISDPSRMKKDFWDTIHNPNKVNVNLLTDKDLHEAVVDGKTVLIVTIPRATRRQRPVFINNNLFGGTFRRNFEGDYLCKPDEVKRMLTDQAEESPDSRTFEGFSLGDLDVESLKQYRNRFSSFFPQHPWLNLDDTGILEKLGGLRRDRSSSAVCLTAAGLLMFGKNEVIRDPDCIPRFHLDYQEKFSEDPQIRWDNRITPDGTWAGNLFQFFLRVIPRLTSDLAIPFKLENNLFRKDDTVIHEAIREALVNSIIHADFAGVGGIIVRKYRAKLEFSNPGSQIPGFK